MTEEKADDLLAYLRELWLATPVITKELLEDRSLTHIDVRGQIKPTDTDLLKFKYGIDKFQEGFAVSKYKAFIIDDSPIQHLNNDIVDTAKTEQILKSINWNQSYDELKGKMPNIEDTINDVLFLKLLGPTKDIADKLMIKHWYDTPMQDHVDLEAISGLAMPQAISIPVTGDFSDVDLKEAYALLSGRAVMKAQLEDGNFPTPYWLLYEDGKFVQLPAFDLDKIIRSLPYQNQMDENTFTFFMTSLAKGEIVPTELVIEGRSAAGGLIVDPRSRNVDFYDNQGEKIELNARQALKHGGEKIAKSKFLRGQNSRKTGGPRL